MAKRCNTCKEEKPEEDFPWYSPSGKKIRHPRCRACKKAYDRNYKVNNRERFRKAQKKFREKHPERWRELQRAGWHKWRAAKMHPGAEDIQLEELYYRDEGVCKICSHKCSQADASIDHDIPLSRGGTHTWNNVQLAHLLCNKMKNNKTTEEYRAAL